MEIQTIKNTASPNSVRVSGENKIFKILNHAERFKGRRLWSLVFDLPGEKVNKLNTAVMDEFKHVLSELESLSKEDQPEALVLTSGKPGAFIAGADIEMIQGAKSQGEAERLSAMGHELIDRWEDLPFPTVAAIDGAALGGGCEFALASSAIAMSDSQAAKMGLPEVMLGLIPGMGGCIRLPRKIGLAAAFDLILTGKTLSGDRAAKAGLVEVCFPKQNFEDSVFRWTSSQLESLRAEKRIAREPKLAGSGGMLGSVMENTPIGRAIIFKKAIAGVLSKTRGQYPAPLEAIEVIRDTGAHYSAGKKLRGAAREKAMAREAQGFGNCAGTEVSKNLIRLFFLTESVKKSKGIDAALPERHPVHQAAVLGAGVMGGGIAQLLADKQISARMKDLSTAALALGVQSAGAIFSSQVKKKRINRRQFLQKMNYISPVLDYSGFQTSEVVIEAVVENMEIKKKVFQELENYVKPGCVIASNTSSLSITEMQKAFKKPGRFVGMHFFNPVHKMPLIEVIRGAQSSDEAVSAVFQFSKQLGKTPIVVKDAPGFLVNRLLAPYLNEATYLVVDGVPIPDIDRVFLEFGMPMGPLELIDEVGVDVGVKVAHILHNAFGDRMTPAPMNEKVVKAGRLGKKNGKGIYIYEKNERKFGSEIYSILEVSPQAGAVSDQEILERCIFPMINEAARCLEEKIVASASDVDLGMIMGTGFPPFRGGLLRYADSVGARKVVEGLKQYIPRFGARFEPSLALTAYAEKGRKFYEHAS